MNSITLAAAPNPRHLLSYSTWHAFFQRIDSNHGRTILAIIIMLVVFGLVLRTLGRFVLAVIIAIPVAWFTWLAWNSISGSKTPLWTSTRTPNQLGDLIFQNLWSFLATIVALFFGVFVYTRTKLGPSQEKSGKFELIARVLAGMGAVAAMLLAYSVLFIDFHLPGALQSSWNELQTLWHQTIDQKK